MKLKLVLSLSACLFMSVMVWGQKTVTGSITASDGTPLIGVNILEKGTSNGTVSDFEGNYSLNSGSDNPTLVFSFTGFETQEIAVGNQTTLDVIMSEGVALGEVVVTALGIEREKKALGYSVTEVSGEDFVDAREINIANSLAGKVAGVNVSSTATGPGGSSRIVIRGNSSLTGNNQPLIVIDGVPIDNRNLGAAGMWGGSDYGDGLSSVNPDDVESMTVLKGNTAAALYGSRAANGVILITTKSGSAGDGINVDFSTNYTFENVIDLYDFQKEYGHGTLGAKPGSQDDAIQFGLNSWGDRLDGSSVVQFDGVSRPYSDAGDNLSRFYQTGGTWTNSLGLTGGNQAYNFRIGVTDVRNEGIVPNSGLDRTTFTSKVSATLSERFTATLSGSYVNEEVQNRPRLSDSPGNANYTVWSLPPTINVEDLAGPEGDGSDETGGEFDFNDNTFVTNPYWAAYHFDATTKKNRLFGNFSLRYDFTDFLYLQGRIGVDTYDERRRNVEGYGTNYKLLGSVNESTRTFTETNMDFILGYDDRFGAFGVNAFVGGNQMNNKFESINIGGNELNVPFLESVANVKNQGYGYGISEVGINSFYGSIEFSYGDFIYVTATGRNDWFSTLTKADGSGENNIFYPSVGASFVLSDAVSLPTWITFAKLRGSWAQVGGDTDPYALALTYGLVGQGHLGNPLGGIGTGRIPNSNLVPETNTEIEFGLDFRLFNNRVGVDFAYYDRVTEDGILNASISSTSGFGSQVVNVGEVANKGFELLLNVTPVKTRNLQWDLSFNMNQNDSEVVSLLDPENDEEDIRLSESRTRNAYIHHKEGFPYSVIMGNNEDGEFDVLGNGVHDFIGGINNSISWKELTLSFLVDFKTGGDIYAATNAYGWLRGLHKETLVGREDGITIDGENVGGYEEVQEFYQNAAFLDTWRFVEDASFIKLRQLSLTYRLPSSILANTPIKGLSIGFVGRNLALLWSKVDNIDPESTFSNGNAQGLEMFGVPRTRTFGFDLNVKF